jgi:hypothetical protein
MKSRNGRDTCDISERILRIADTLRERLHWENV